MDYYDNQHYNDAMRGWKISELEGVIDDDKINENNLQKYIFK